MIEAAVMGAVMGAVSPAIVVPRMVQLMDSGYGTAKSIPQMIMAGASCDDIFVVVLFTTFTGMAQGGNVRAADFIDIPISIVSGIALGAFTGYVLSEKFGKLWIAEEVILFVLVGEAVDIRYTAEAGAMAVLMIFAALIFRAAGVCICMIKTRLNFKEWLFCVIAYLPKATVQAAIGSVPLAMGLPCGQIVLSVAVIAILITAPLGALGMDLTYRRLLVREKKFIN